MRKVLFVVKRHRRQNTSLTETTMMTKMTDDCEQDEAENRLKLRLDNVTNRLFAVKPKKWELLEHCAVECMFVNSYKSLLFPHADRS